ncbi:efflux RND transporter periplasmic adaptor subunit [Jannaschia sp. 2305UL9-9]|uniref:efflux RND transporter periplasmic adaptor subunit n=1 Tax=Jannaschia sp. 2305UL9-9 TaxID=3121638 RepID=UPI0035297FB5
MRHVIKGQTGRSGLIGGCLAVAVLMLASAAQADSPFVKLHQVTVAEDGLRRVFFGRVVARETVSLAFQVGGQIVEFPVEEGERLPAGATIARLDEEPFEIALDEALAQDAQVTRLLDRYQQLQGTTISATSVEDAQTDKEIADLAVRNAERNLKNAVLHAPFEALVSARLVANFSTVAAGEPIARLHDMSDLRIEIDVPETLFQRAGQDAEIALTAEFPGLEGTFPLEVREYNAETAQVGQTYSITLGMTPPEGFVILPGSSAEVTAILGSDEMTIEIPASAVMVGDDSQTSVMIFEPVGTDEGTVTRVPVEIEPTDNGAVQVISGLERGQEIVAAGMSSLEDGQTVRRFTGFGN